MQTENVFSLFLGDAKTLKMKVTSPHCTCDEVTNAVPNNDPIDLTTATDIAIALPNADGTFTTLLLSMSQVVIAGNPLLGTFSAAITSEVSALLMTGVFQDINVTFTFPGTVYTVNFPQVLSVLEMR